MLATGNYQQYRDGWSIDMRVRDSRGRETTGSCFVETRSGDVSLYGFGWGNDGGGGDSDSTSFSPSTGPNTKADLVRNSASVALGVSTVTDRLALAGQQALAGFLHDSVLAFAPNTPDPTNVNYLVERFQASLSH